MIAWYWVLSFWFPLRAGRDFITWFLYFRDILRVEPESTLLMLYRTPLTPLFYGAGFQFVGQFGIECVLSVLYGLSAGAIFLVMRKFGRVAAWLTLLLAALNLWIFNWYNAVGSETLQTVLLCLWFSLAFFAMRSLHVRLWAVLALVVFLMVLNRPANQTFALCGLLPLLIPQGTWKRRFLLCGCFVGIYAAAHVGYASLNSVRFGQFCIAKLGNAHLPFYRLFVQEHVISPDNGPASARLAQFVESRVLSDPVFQEHEITRDIFFTYSSQRMFNSLIFALQREGAVDGEFSLAQDYVILKKAAMESLLNDPRGSACRYFEQLLNVFNYKHHGPFRWKIGKKSRKLEVSNLRDLGNKWKKRLQEQLELYARKGIPIPNEGDFLPARAVYFCPENGNKSNWLGIPFEAHPWDLRPVTSPNPAADQLLRISEHFIPDYRWFLASFFCFSLSVVFGQRDFRIPLLTCIAMVSLLASLFASVQWEFRCPFDFILTAFFVFGFCSLFQHHMLLRGDASRKKEKSLDMPHPEN